MVEEISKSISDVGNVIYSNTLRQQAFELTKVFDNRQNDDDLKEILHITTPIVKPNEANVWHLERIAASEFEAKPTTRQPFNTSAIKTIKKDSYHTKAIINDILKKGKEHEAKREVMKTQILTKQQKFQEEIEATKTLVNRSSLTFPTDSALLSSPVPVSERLLGTDGGDNS